MKRMKIILIIILVGLVLYKEIDPKSFLFGLILLLVAQSIWNENT